MTKLIRVAGATLIEIDDQGTPPTEEMRRAINENTAAIFFMATVMNHPGLCTTGGGCINGDGQHLCLWLWTQRQSVHRFRP